MLIHPMHAEIDRHRRREPRESIRRRRLARLAAQDGPSRRLSRALGRSMIRIGSRLAADPIPQGARSR
jgi:hypothetical protein